MDSADILITKPGGISTTEACAKKLPMLFIDSVKGCESYNLEYFVSRGAAIDADDINEAVRLIEMFCNLPDILSEIKCKMPVTSVSPAAVICETMIPEKDEAYDYTKQAVTAF